MFIAIKTDDGRFQIPQISIAVKKPTKFRLLKFLQKAVQEKNFQTMQTEI